MSDPNPLPASGRGRVMASSRVRHLDWSVGCGTFAALFGPGGGELLIETLWFTEREAAVVNLHSGEREIIAWPTLRPIVRVLEPDVACAQVGMPVPGRIKVADSWRRVDPFHSERHRSERFRALIAVIRDLRLPCRYSLLAFADTERPAAYTGPCVEDPEQTAGNVAERLARTPALSVADALHAELLDDATCVSQDPAAAAALLAKTAWPATLARLDELLASAATATACLPLPWDDQPDAAQLGLFDEGVLP